VRCSQIFVHAAPRRNTDGTAQFARLWIGRQKSVPIGLETARRDKTSVLCSQ
jgi:hypothetical protein